MHFVIYEAKLLIMTMVNWRIANILQKICVKTAFFPPSENRAFLRQLQPYYVDTKQRQVYFSVVKRVPTAELFYMQYVNEHFAKYSIITKICSLEEYVGHNKIGKAVDFMTARNHSNKTIDSWSRRLYDVYDRIKRDGFDQNFPIEVDTDMRIINGSHRFACACQLGIPYVPVRVVDVTCSADDPLFVYEEELLPKITIEQRKILHQLHEQLCSKFRYPFYMLCPTKCSEQILNLLHEQKCMLVSQIGQIDNVETKRDCSMRLLEIKIHKPQYNLNAFTGTPFCIEMQFLRILCMRLFPEADIQVSDNYDSSKKIKDLLG